MCVQGTQPVLQSVLGEQAWEFRAPFILEMAAIGPDCFDCEYYQETNPDLAGMSCWSAFSHFINYGQFEMRSHRCARPRTPLRSLPQTGSP